MGSAELMELVVNDRPVSAPMESTVGDLLAILKEADPHMIVELNGRLVYPTRYADTILGNGDRLEIINPDFGG